MTQFNGHSVRREQSQLTLILQMINFVLQQCLLELRHRRGSQDLIDHFGQEHMVSKQVQHRHHHHQALQQNLRCTKHGNREILREEML